MPIIRTWNIATLNELSGHSKETFVDYPEAPHGVNINGEIIEGDGKSMGRERLARLRARLRNSRIHANALPD